VARHLGPGAEAMTRAADFALYAAKAAPGRGNQRLFDAALAAEIAERGARLTALERAVAEGALEVWLQPKVRLATGATTGFEALVRWRRGGEVVPPAEFVSLAEESGLIVDIDLFVLQAATRRVAERNRAQGARLGLSVNLSTQHMASRRIVDEVARALDASGLPPDLLTLELTESMAVRDWVHVLETVDRLKALGCRISLDDFGTGYSSLGYLRRLPADELKLDKSFVAELDRSDQARWIVDGVVDIARSLRMRVVIEGIETPAQAEIAADLGCEIGQGFLFGRPRPAEEALGAALAAPPAGAPGRRLG
jgi:EAL domain-containing protein (putative c-di-GMP-specific phosphodiesterase class I)